MSNFTNQIAKIRLDKFLAQNCPLLSRGKIQNDIKLGLAQVNGKAIAIPHFALKIGDVVSYVPSPEKISQPENLNLNIISQTEDYLVINKPSGLTVHPGNGVKEASLEQALRFHFPQINNVGENGRAGIVHRLDKDTSGLIVCALNQQMYEHLKSQFQNRKVQKEYIALVVGNIIDDHGEITQSLGKSRSDYRKYTSNIEDMLLEKDARTEYQVLEQLKTGVDLATLIKVKLHTGRTHQIRVHFAESGFPVVGDSLYGKAKALKFGIKRQFLHSFELGFKNLQNEEVKFKAPLPDDLTNLLTKLKSKQINLL